jgi:glucose-1-phosphate cytidylyltransferase
VQPSGRFGALEIDAHGSVCAFREKPKGDDGRINGGFFVFESEVFRYIENDSTIFERRPLEMLAEEGQLMAYKHDAFWKAMDTLREKRELDDLYKTRRAPWMFWHD